MSKNKEVEVTAKEAIDAIREIADAISERTEFMAMVQLEGWSRDHKEREQIREKIRDYFLNNEDEEEEADDDA